MLSMPTYEYECPACEATFERFQPITAKPVRRCPECGGRRVRRLLSAGGGFIFRGSGFYQTDYRSSNYQQQAKSESTSSSASKAEKSTETPGHKPGKKRASSSK
jgi:putative FmdB family regulatory protein